EAEQAIVEILHGRYPDAGIQAEESGGRKGNQATWCIDPLDGTINFLSGIPHYAVSIALVGHAGCQLDGADPLAVDTPLVGVVLDPNREELFTAVHGLGAWLNGRRIQCSDTATLEHAVLATGLPFRDFSFESRYMPILDAAMHGTRGVRRFGSAALDLAWVACGRYDGYWEMGLAPWDVAAGTVLVRAAGGVCEDLQHRCPWPETGFLYAANRRLAAPLHLLIEPHA
ncbi:inositol monophosphatase family protein, partial [Castellaniella sp.]|uniref:inositol monophosphatase family protein n=1 Tax=Castellaniella sp. TaxID=1955812 RepID=UPI0035612A86